MIVLDASVLIAHLDTGDLHHERATELLFNAAEEQLGASPLTLAEVLVGPARADKLHVAEHAIRELEVVTIHLRADAPPRLAELRTKTGLRLPDCCVLLAAETADAQIASFEDRLVAAAIELGFIVCR